MLSLQIPPAAPHRSSLEPWPQECGPLLEVAWAARRRCLLIASKGGSLSDGDYKGVSESKAYPPLGVLIIRILLFKVLY